MRLMIDDDWKYLSVGESFKFLLNQGWRLAYVLAVIGDEILFEYEMPHGTTALQIADQKTGKTHSISYFRLTKKWLEAIVGYGTVWIGNPQQGKYLAVLDRQKLEVTKQYDQR